MAVFLVGAREVLGIVGRSRELVSDALVLTLLLTFFGTFSEDMRG
jgi:hypothetical protein